MAFQANRDSIDLALLDVLMPRRSGREVFEVIREARPDLPVVFCSGYSRDLLDLSRGSQCAVDLIHKPFSRHDLLASVQSLLPVESPARGSAAE